mgnify:CR=1 FL=1
MINIVRRYQDVPQLVLILQEIYFLLHFESTRRLVPFKRPCRLLYVLEGFSGCVELDSCFHMIHLQTTTCHLVSEKLDLLS